MGSQSDLSVCVVGAGTAGLEALLSLREEMPGAELRLIAPDGEFRYRPMSTDSPFRPAPERALSIASLVQSIGATWVADRADLIDPVAGTVLTRDGATVGFDHLLLAAGSRAERALAQGSVWERGADPTFLDETLRAIASNDVRSVGVAIPRGARWPLPAYELALVLAWRAAETGSAARVTLVTVEERPLGALGSEASEAVSRQLQEAGVEVLAGVEALEHRSDAAAAGSGAARVTLVSEAQEHTPDPLSSGSSEQARARIDSGRTVEFDRLISLPTISGPFLSGVPTDAAGFVEVDETLQVCGSRRVWAAGGCVAAALEHSALSAGQADAAAGAIAAAAGASTQSPPAPPELTGLLLGGQREQWLAENPPETHEPSTRCLWWPPGRAVGRMLAQHIAALDTDIAQALPNLPAGVPIRVPVALDCSGQPSSGEGMPGASGPPSPEDRAARLRDIEQRQLMALSRRERSAEADLRELSTRLQTLESSQEKAIRELRKHGYLRGRDGSR